MKACFPGERAAQIYSYALIMCANGFVHIDQIDDFYQESFLSVMYRNYAFKMGYTALTNLLHDLGLRGNPVKAFEQSLINNSSKNIAIDGHVIRSCSGENDLAEPGYKMNLLKASQVNLLIAYDIKNKIPLMYRTYRGSSVDKSSVLEFLRSRSFTDTKFIVDRGFYSDSVLSLMSENRNCYIIPVPSNNKHFRRIKKTLAYTSGEFVYKSGKKDCARIVYYEEQIDENTRIIVYKDEDENNSKRKSYKQMIDLDFVPSHQRLHSLAREVHVSLRFHKQAFLASNVHLHGQRLVFAFPVLVRVSQFFNRHKARVVVSVSVLSTRISKTDDDVHNRYEVAPKAL